MISMGVIVTNQRMKLLPWIEKYVYFQPTVRVSRALCVFCLTCSDDGTSSIDVHVRYRHLFVNGRTVWRREHTKVESFLFGAKYTHSRADDCLSCKVDHKFANDILTLPRRSRSVYPIGSRLTPPVEVERFKLISVALKASVWFEQFFQTGRIRSAY